ncbi:hypothetical protein [Winogradskyella sp. A2]|uniref:hypothetical protein n=1 Tax=Winogradskyella sp. A2 TaxID=3366944 RepID=UPI00398C608B
MKKHFIFISLFLITMSSFGQKKLLPPKMEIKDPVLKEFISNLKNAVKKKDKEYILSILSSDILVSFGGNGGIEEFKSRWNWSSDDSSFWKTMDKILQLGGEKYKGGGIYSIPYVFSNWPRDDEKYGAFEHMAITGTNVNVRNNPDLKKSEIVGQFSYDIVKVDYEKSIRSIDETIWYYTESLDGKLKGYVFRDYIWSPVGYRATFEFIDNEWKMTVFVGGD